MNSLTYFIGPILAIALIVVVVSQLLRKRLRERHAMWWMAGAFAALIISLFPTLLDGLSAWLGFVAPLNLVLIFAIALVFLVSLQHSSELTELEEKVRVLAEKVAELEMDSPIQRPGESGEN